MSDEWVDMIWIGISLIIGAVLLSIIFFFNGVGHDLTSAVYQEEADARAMQVARITMPYDEAKNISGSEVLSAMMDLADKNIFTFVYANGAWYSCGPIGTTSADAVAQLNRTDKKSSASVGEYFTPQSYTVDALFDKFDKLYDGSTMAVQKFNSTLAIENGTSNALAVIFTK